MNQLNALYLESQRIQDAIIAAIQAGRRIDDIDRCLELAKALALKFANGCHETRKALGKVQVQRAKGKPVEFPSPYDTVRL